MIAQYTSFIPDWVPLAILAALIIIPMFCALFVRWKVTLFWMISSLVYYGIAWLIVEFFAVTAAEQVMPVIQNDWFTNSAAELADVAKPFLFTVILIVVELVLTLFISTPIFAVMHHKYKKKLAEARNPHHTTTHKTTDKKFWSNQKNNIGTQHTAKAGVKVRVHTVPNGIFSALLTLLFLPVVINVTALSTTVVTSVHEINKAEYKNDYVKHYSTISKLANTLSFNMGDPLVHMQAISAAADLAGGEPYKIDGYSEIFNKDENGKTDTRPGIQWIQDAFFKMIPKNLDPNEILSFGSGSGSGDAQIPLLGATFKSMYDIFETKNNSNAMIFDTDKGIGKDWNSLMYLKSTTKLFADIAKSQLISVETNETSAKTTASPILADASTIEILPILKLLTQASHSFNYTKNNNKSFVQPINEDQWNSIYNSYPKDIKALLDTCDPFNIEGETESTVTIETMKTDIENLFETLENDPLDVNDTDVLTVLHTGFTSLQPFFQLYGEETAIKLQDILNKLTAKVNANSVPVEPQFINHSYINSSASSINENNYKEGSFASKMLDLAKKERLVFFNKNCHFNFEGGLSMEMSKNPLSELADTQFTDTLLDAIIVGLGGATPTQNSVEGEGTLGMTITPEPSFNFGNVEDINSANNTTVWMPFILPEHKNATAVTTSEVMSSTDPTPETTEFAPFLIKVGPDSMDILSELLYTLLSKLLPNFDTMSDTNKSEAKIVLKDFAYSIFDPSLTVDQL